MVNEVLAEWNLKPVCFGKPACLSAFVCIGQRSDVLCYGRRCVWAGILSRRSFRGTTAFYFAQFWDWRAKGGARAIDITGFRCDGEGITVVMREFIRVLETRKWLRRG